MMFLIRRGKHLSVPIGRLLKLSDTINSCSLPRTLYTKNSSTLRCVYKQERIRDIKNCIHTQKISEGFGEVIELNEFEEDEDHISSRRKQKSSRGRGKFHAKGTSSESKQNENDTRFYGKMKQNTKTLGVTMGNMKAKHLKEEKDEIFIEGRRLISDACFAGWIPKKVFYSRSSDLEELNLPENTPLLRVPYAALKLWSETETTQGIIAVFSISTAEKTKVDNNCIPLTVICDNVRDPGNLGSILRVTAAVGCQKLILTSGCVNVWGQKALRAGAGAHFHFPIMNNVLWPTIEEEISKDSEVFLSVSSCHKNVKNSSHFTKISELSDSLPSASCFNVEFKNKNTVIVIGGETHGISKEAYEFAKSRNGSGVFIPMNNDIESLNTSVALGILIYEFKRQIIRNTEKDSQLLTENHAS